MSDRWTRIKSLFAEATELPIQARSGFLDKVCNGDSDLRTEVETLLRASDESDDFLIPPTRTGTIGMNHGHERSLHSRIGPYEIVRRLGAGGMGTVYLAERVDGQVHTKVAVKIVKRGMDTEQILLRFANERQALADLHHPNIASFLDAGVTEDGLPYIIMEYVDGERIDRHCAAHQLDVRQRLNLFRQVCESVSHAHRNLFLHRDLKPSNILITAEGEPKLLDFGLAKVLTPGAHDATRSLTSTEQRFLTPDYASPEQILGKHMNTTSDVYSLGVLLYTLLTGRPPHLFRSKPTREIERILMEESATSPSAVVTALGAEINTRDADFFADFLEGLPSSEATTERLSRTLRGDLDNILQRALHIDPTRRYASVDQFREDIDRYLGGLPVLARKDTIVYRAGKFIKRHRNMVITASVVAVLAIGGGVAIAWQAKVASDARERETMAIVQESAVQAMFLALLTATDPGAGEPVGAVDMLFERFRTRIDRGLSAVPEVDAKYYEHFGRLYQAQGRHSEAARILRRAVGVRQTIPDARNTPAMASSLHLLGAVLIDAGEFTEAENVLRSALGIRIQLFGESDNRVAGVMDNLTELLARQGRYEEGRAMFRRAEAIYTRTLEFPDLHLLEQSIKLANIMLERGDLDEAQAMHDVTLVEVQSKLGDDDEFLIGLLLIDAKIHRGRNDLEGSRSLHEELLVVLDRVHEQRDHPIVAETLASAAETLSLLGEHDQAIEFYDQALSIQRLIYGPNHPITARTARKLELVLQDASN